MDRFRILVNLLRLGASLGGFAAAWSLRKGRAQRQRTITPPAAGYPALPCAQLSIEAETFLDQDEPDPMGWHSYSYSGTNYVFTCGDRRASGRTYEDEPHKLSLVLPPAVPVEAWSMYAEVPYGDPMLQAIAAYVAKHLPERSEITLLCRGGYLPVDRERVRNG